VEKQGGNRRKVMSNAPYEKECLYCKNKILMSKETGKWLPYNLNNGPHDCRNKSKQTTITEPKKQEFTLDAVLKKLESIGMKIDLDKLMNQK
jgi:hypothetical protein